MIRSTMLIAGTMVVSGCALETSAPDGTPEPNTSTPTEPVARKAIERQDEAVQQPQGKTVAEPVELKPADRPAPPPPPPPPSGLYIINEFE